jgi:hypothetical protein
MKHPHRAVVVPHEMNMGETILQGFGAITLAVLTGMAVLFFWPHRRPPRFRTAILGCVEVRQAAEIYRALDGPCPTVEELTRAKVLNEHRAADAWLTPYFIDCRDGEIHVVSAGDDRTFGTADDLRDDFKEADAERVERVMDGK